LDNFSVQYLLAFHVYMKVLFSRFIKYFGKLLLPTNFFGQLFPNRRNILESC
jgi:hypothetical protein